MLSLVQMLQYIREHYYYKAVLMAIIARYKDLTAKSY